MTEIKPTETTNVVATVDPKLIEAIENLTKSNAEFLAACQKKAVEEEETKKKDEEEEAKKKEAAKFAKYEETITALKQEIATLKQEKKPVEKDPKEPDEDDKVAKKEVKSAGVKVEPIVTAETKPTNLYDACIQDLKQAAKDLRIWG